MAHASAQAVRPLLGRESQLAVATARLADLDGRRGALLLLSGEPGIGKTRLAEEVVGLARERGFRTAWATAWQGEGAPPLWPWVQILRQLAGSEEMLGQFVAESPAASAAACFAQSEAISAVVRGVASTAPLVVVLDDLQWADPASIRVLCFVASAVRDVGCLLVGTYRPDELGREQVAELARVGVTLAVPRLSDEAASELLRSAAGDQVSAAATGTIIERSAGNPLFVWEFGQLMAQSGRVDVAPAAVPQAVAAVIERRLARLSEAAVATLRAAAVAGDPFSVETVARISGGDGCRRCRRRGGGPRRGVRGSGRSRRTTSGSATTSCVTSSSRASTRRVERTCTCGSPRCSRSACAIDASMHAVVADHLDQAGPDHAEAAAAHWEQAARPRPAGARLRRGRRLPRARRTCCWRRPASAGCAGRRGGRLPAARRRPRRGAGALPAALRTWREGIDAPETMARAVLGMGAGPVAWEVPIGSAEQAALVADALELPARRRRRAAVDAAGAPVGHRRHARDHGDGAAACRRGPRAGPTGRRPRAHRAGPGRRERRLRRPGAHDGAARQRRHHRRAGGHRGRPGAGAAGLPLPDRGRPRGRRRGRRRPQHRRLHPAWPSSFASPSSAGTCRCSRGCGPCWPATSMPPTAASARLPPRPRPPGATTPRCSPRPCGSASTWLGAAACDPDAFDELFDVDPAGWASFAAGLAMVKLHGGEPDRARELLKLHADNGFAHLGEDGEHLTTLVLFGRVAVALDEPAAARAGLRPAVARSRGCGPSTGSPPAPGARSSSSSAGSRSRSAGTPRPARTSRRPAPALNGLALGCSRTRRSRSKAKWRHRFDVDSTPRPRSHAVRVGPGGRGRRRVPPRRPVLDAVVPGSHGADEGRQGVARPGPASRPARP